MLKKLSLGLASIFVSALLSVSAYAHTSIDLGISLSASSPPPPPTTVVMAAPGGYNSCYTAPGGWMGNVWVPPHQECEYPAPTGTAMWVSGYWGCVSVGPAGNCGNWRWYGHRWVRGPYAAYHGHAYGHGYGYGYGHRGRHW